MSKANSTQHVRDEYQRTLNRNKYIGVNENEPQSFANCAEFWVLACCS